MQAVNIVWFKRDLRIEDHIALSSALEAGSIIALYCWEPAIWQAEDASASQQAFVSDCLRSLRLALKNQDIPLHISALGIVETLNFLAKQTTIRAVYSHEETGNLASYAVDKAVATWCKVYQVKWHEFPQNGVVRRLKNRDHWHVAWESRMQSAIVKLPSGQANHRQFKLPIAPITIANGLDKPQRQPGGREAALATLSSFLAQRSAGYRGGISSPIKAAEASSRISPYLAWGCVSIREVVQQNRLTMAELREQNLPKKPAQLLGLQSFESRLHWHCHFMQKLESEPTVELQHMHLAHAGMRDETLADVESQRRLNAWCAGQTGWPLVDACMSMLREQGWINFRMRAMLMSTASYLLWLHWRQTGLHLAREFVDYEPGIHWPQVQMQSGSTGINTLRIYNPIKQAQDQDPHGHFVRKWIPALRRVPDAWIFEPYLMPANLQLQYGCVLEKDYPKPLVDIATAMRHAKQHISAARKNYPHTQETQGVLIKHGSRKNQSSSKTKNLETKKSKAKEAKNPQQALF